MITLFDIIVFIIITTSSILGGYSGIIKLTISLLGFLLSILLTYYLYPYVLEIIIHYSKNEVVLTILSGIISYIISIVICTFITYKVIAIISNISGGSIDRILGLLAGFLRGSIICLFLFLIITIFTSSNYLKAFTLEDIVKDTNVDKYPEWLKKSLTSLYLDNINRSIIAMIPEGTLRTIKLPQEFKGKNVTNMLNNTHKNDQSLQADTLPSNLKHELDEMLSTKTKHKDK